MAHENVDDGGILVISVACFLAAMLFLVPGILALWARWLPRRTSTPASVTRAAYFMLTLGFAVTFLIPAAEVAYAAFLVRLPAAATDRPADRSRRLASAISEALFNSALVWLLTVGVTALWLLFATWRYHWSVRPAVPTREPPYR